MVKIEIDTTTLAVLIAGIYCAEHQVDNKAIPQSLWLNIAEKLEYFTETWDYNKISLEEWINTCLFIYPTELLEESILEDMMTNTLYWEVVNGNVILSVSMDVKELNNV